MHEHLGEDMRSQTDGNSTLSRKILWTTLIISTMIFHSHKSYYLLYLPLPTNKCPSCWKTSDHMVWALGVLFLKILPANKYLLRLTQLHFTSLYNRARGPKEPRKIEWMNKHTWIPAWHATDNSSFSIKICIKPILEEFESLRLNLHQSLLDHKCLGDTFFFL